MDPNGEHWYYLWMDDLFQAVDELMASVSNIVFGRAASKKALYDPQGAKDLYNSRPFQDVKPSKEIQIFTEFMYDTDVVIDASVSVSLPHNTYVKAGVSTILSPNKDIQSTYAHTGVGVSFSPDIPVSISYSIGIVKGINTKEDYAGPFWDVGGTAAYGLDYCWWPSGSSAYSYTVSNGAGLYAGFDWYWCLS